MRRKTWKRLKTVILTQTLMKAAMILITLKIKEAGVILISENKTKGACAPFY